MAADTVRLTDIGIANADVFGKAVPHSFRQGRQIHLVYTDKHAVYYLRSSDAGLTWDRPRLIADGSAADAQIVGNAEGRLYIFYARGGGIYTVNSADNGGSWSAPDKISGVYNRSKNPCAVVSGLGDIYVVWENNGVILCRRYHKDAAVWQNITDLSGGDSELPLIVNYRSRALYAVWLEKGEVVCRLFDLARETWGAPEQVSAEANQKLRTVPANCRELAIAVNSQNNLHVVWSNGGQLLHRVRAVNLWSNTISRLTENYISGFGSPSVAFDASGCMFISYIEGNAVTLCRYNARAGSWDENKIFTLDSPKYFASMILGGSNSYNEQLPGYLRGFDVFWVEREPNKPAGTLAFNSRAEGLETCQKTPPTGGTETNNGPELFLTGIDADALQLYSPEPSTLYYSGLLETEKDFIIRGSVRDRGAGVSLITFSPSFGSRPAPVENLSGGVWSARYTIRATDAPDNIIITAYDSAGRTTTRIVSVRKDITPPDPPAWARIWPDHVSTDNAVMTKISRARQVSVTWADAADKESGVHYYTMGNRSRWWQNARHQSGDSETADEGENTFYVFAVDRVGNVSLPAAAHITIDSIPPLIFEASHNAAGQPLRAGDKLIVSLRGEPNGRAFFSISGLAQNIPLWDAGQDGDARAKDGVYTGVYAISPGQSTGQHSVSVFLFDAAGNLSEQTIAAPLDIVPRREQPPPLPRVAETEPEPEQEDNGAALMSPYLDLELTPPILTRGSAQTVKISVPPEIAVARAYVVWGRLNRALQTTKLWPSGGDLFSGEYKVPADLQLGEQQGLVFLQDRDGVVYKKPFYYRVLSPNNKPAQDLLTAQFFPHPLVPARDIRVQAVLPVSVKSKQVVLFLAAEQSKVISVVLTRGGAPSPRGYEVWQGVLSLPENTAAGEYFANIICKTEKGEFIKKKIKYSVHK
ncbi:putative BNR2 super family [Candidatus Termititenax aidoneus]|uniref:BNR2 super family n=1 Tax=Termititenax aidoneus TaxID=2218524 RepID=A0A388TDJ6_TERA1|nr:putative BNR2 super family [Candidatus Termititenax aidoneus]